MNRRQFLTRVGVSSVGLTAAALALPGCANPANEPVAPASTVSTPAAGRFPAQVVHRYGTTTIAAAPQKIIALGQTDLDPVLALGSVPIAVGSFIGTDYTPIRPWNSALATTQPTKLNMQELEFEKIAALQPDLILCVMSGVTKSDYVKLAAIAPTVAQHKDYDDWAIPYRPHTEIIGAALGQPEAAAALVADLDAQFAKVRTDNPGLVGRTAFCAEMWGSDFDVIGPTAPRTHFLTDIGMTLPQPLLDLVGTQYNAPISAEKLNLLDGLDVVLWTTEHTDQAKMLQNTLVAGLRTTREGRFVLAPNGNGQDDLLYAIDWGTVLSNRYAIEHAVPRFVLAVDGNPATDPNV